MARQTRSAAIKALATASALQQPLNVPVATPAPTPATTAVADPSSSSPPQRLFESHAAWELWLSGNHLDPVGVWLQIAKKTSPTPSVTYDQALDAALCYGWIDGQRRSLDAHFFLQRFTPRRKGSVWSRRNVDKVAALAAAGKMQPSGEAEVAAAKKDGRWERAYAGSSKIEVPADFAAALEKEKGAKRFFDGLGKTERYRFLWRIETAKRPETRKRKIAEFVALLKEHKKL